MKKPRRVYVESDSDSDSDSDHEIKPVKKRVARMRPMAARIYPYPPPAIMTPVRSSSDSESSETESSETENSIIDLSSDSDIEENIHMPKKMPRKVAIKVAPTKKMPMKMAMPMKMGKKMPKKTAVMSDESSSESSENNDADDDMDDATFDKILDKYVEDKKLENRDDMDDETFNKLLDKFEEEKNKDLPIVYATLIVKQSATLDMNNTKKDVNDKIKKLFKIKDKISFIQLRKNIISYINSNNLTSKEDPTIFKLNKDLAGALNLNENTYVKFGDINKLIDMCFP